MRWGVCAGLHALLSSCVHQTTAASHVEGVQQCAEEADAIRRLPCSQELICGGGRKGQRDAMPECIKGRIRETYPREKM